ncbi:hypothetical protein MSPP1_000769 [Malassezia sp. CBS 17886]|nr:hypothetical protein MSPP1_000769 [Malassezia sp. CBS 17886]
MEPRAKRSQAEQYPGGHNKYKTGWETLPPVPGAKIDNTTFTVGKHGATMTTYVTEGYDESKVKRAVINVHGEYRDAWNQWQASNESATSAIKAGGVKNEELVICAPMFFSIQDVGAYSVDENNVSDTKTLVWDTNGWGNIQDAIYPMFNKSGALDNEAYRYKNAGSSLPPKKKTKSKAKDKTKDKTKEKAKGKAKDKRKLLGISAAAAAEEGPHVASLDVLDAYVNFFSDKDRFPNMKTIVIAGFSLGGQTVERYIAFRPDRSKDDMINYWVSSPGSFLYLSPQRPFPPKKGKCPKFDEFKYGLQGNKPAYWERTQKDNSPDTIRDRFLSRKTTYLVGANDTIAGDKGCEAMTQGKNHIERMDNWVKGELPYLPNNPDAGKIPPTITYGQIDNTGHDAEAIITSSAGVQTLYLEDYDGRGKNAQGPTPLQDGSANGGVGKTKKMKSGAASNGNSPWAAFVAALVGVATITCVAM